MSNTKKSNSLETVNEVELPALKKPEKVTNADLEEMLQKFIRDAALVTKLKEDNRSLKRKIDALIQNNEKFAELVARLEHKNEMIEIKKEEEMIYSYQDKGMVKNEELGKHKLMLHKKKLTLNEINNQLAKIQNKLENEGNNA